MAIVIQKPQVPVENAGFLYVNGMKLSNNAGAPTTVLNIAPGQCRDHTNTNDIVINAVYDVNAVPPVLVSDYVTTSVAVLGAGGIDTGVVEADTMYAVYAIGSSANPEYLVNYAPINQKPPVELPFSKFPGAAILSKSFVAPVLPNGYDMFRRIGTVVTGAGSTIKPFVQTGLNDQSRVMNYSASIDVLVAGAAVAYANVDLNAITPTVPTKPVMLMLLVVFDPNAAGDFVSIKPVTGVEAFATVSASVAGVVKRAQVLCPCSVSAGGIARISYKISNVAGAAAAGGGVDIEVIGFTDLL
jgi:hypothetical protein